MSKKRKARRAHARKRHSYSTNPSRPAKRRRRRHHAVSFKTNPRRRRSYRRNPGDSPKDIFIMIGAGLAAAIAAPKLVSKMPGSLMVKNLAMILAGVALLYLAASKMPWSVWVLDSLLQAQPVQSPMQSPCLPVMMNSTATK